MKTRSSVDEGREVVEATATEQFGSREVRCRIKDYTWSDDGPRVSFAKRHPDAGPDMLSSWSSTATGGLSSPQRLAGWRRLCIVFDAALREYYDAIQDFDEGGSA